MKARTSKLVPRPIAARIAGTLSAKVGTPETSTGSLLGVWHHEAAWRVRRNDGSAWARLGFGPLRAMVSLSYRDNSPSVLLTVYA